MKRPALALTVLLLASPLSAAVPPELAESARQLARFPSTRGQGSESERLKRFFDLFWLERLQESPDLATYLGASGFDDRWPDRSPETLELIRRIVRAELSALSSIDRERLTPSERVNYDLARRRIEMRIEGERFHNLDIFENQYLRISPMGDLGFEGLLSSMPARTLQDYENRLARLRGFPETVDQTIALLGQGLPRGITPPRVTLRNVPDQVRSQIVDDPSQSPALQSFENLPATIPAAEGERLRREAARLLAEQVMPALRRLHEYLAKTYVPQARESIAMSDLPDGKAWYAFELRSNTTTDLTPEEIHRLGLAEVARIRKEMDALIASTGFSGQLRGVPRSFCAPIRAFSTTSPRTWSRATATSRSGSIPS